MLFWKSKAGVEKHRGFHRSRRKRRRVPPYVAAIAAFMRAMTSA